MTRVTRSAKTLSQQLLAQWPKAKISNADEPDGFGVHRALAVERPEGAEIFDVLVQSNDLRIDELSLEADKPLVITFSGKTDADSREKFALAIPEKVAEPDKKAPVADQDAPAAPKDPAPAKKAAAKKSEDA